MSQGQLMKLLLAEYDHARATALEHLQSHGYEATECPPIIEAGHNSDTADNPCVCVCVCGLYSKTVC